MRAMLGVAMLGRDRERQGIRVQVWRGGFRRAGPITLDDLCSPYGLEFDGFFQLLVDKSPKTQHHDRKLVADSI